MSDSAEDLLSEIGLGAADPSLPPVTKEPIYIRDLTSEDIQSLSKRAAYGSQQGNLTQKLRAPHHTLARLLAEGKSHVDCSIVTGYTVEYVAMLKLDPAFQELITHYKEQVSAAYLNVHERLAQLGATAMEILQERLTDPEQVAKLSAGALREIMNDALDRSVAPSKVNQGGFGGGAGGDGPKAININFITPPGVPPSAVEGVRSEGGLLAKTMPAGRSPSLSPKFIDAVPLERKDG